VNAEMQTVDHAASPDAVGRFGPQHQHRNQDDEESHCGCSVDYYTCRLEASDQVGGEATFGSSDGSSEVNTDMVARSALQSGSESASEPKVDYHDWKGDFFDPSKDLQTTQQPVEGSSVFAAGLVDPQKHPGGRTRACITSRTRRRSNCAQHPPLECSSTALVGKERGRA
jgi:hypothetical protein